MNISKPTPRRLFAMRVVGAALALWVATLPVPGQAANRLLLEATAQATAQAPSRYGAVCKLDGCHDGAVRRPRRPRRQAARIVDTACVTQA